MSIFEPAQVLVCYKCDRELGPDHDFEKCQRKAMSRRFFLGGVAETAAGAAGIAIAVESGLFGEKSQKIAIEAKKEINNLDPHHNARLGFSGISVRKGDRICVGNESKATLGYGYLPKNMQMLVNRGYMLTVTPDKHGMIIAHHDMQLYAVHGSQDTRVPFKVLSGEIFAQEKKEVLDEPAYRSRLSLLPLV